MASRLSLGLVVIVIALIGLTLCRPPTPTVATVQVLTGASVVMTDEETVRGHNLMKADQQASWSSS